MKQTIGNIREAKKAIQDHDIHYVMSASLFRWNENERIVGVTPRLAEQVMEDTEETFIDGTKYPALVVAQKCSDEGVPQEPEIIIQRVVTNVGGLDLLHASLCGVESLAKNMAEFIDWSEINVDNPKEYSELLNHLIHHKG